MPNHEPTRVRVEDLNTSYRGGEVSLRVTLDARDGDIGAKRGVLSGVTGAVRGLGWVAAGMLQVFCFGFVIVMWQFDFRYGEPSGFVFTVASGIGALIALAGYKASRPLMRRLQAWQNHRGRHPAVTLEIRPEDLLLNDGSKLGKEKIEKVRVVASASFESLDVVATINLSGQERMLFEAVPLTDIDAITVALRKGGLEVED